MRFEQVFMTNYDFFGYFCNLELVQRIEKYDNRCGLNSATVPYFKQSGTNKKKRNKNVYKIFPCCNRMQNLKKIDDLMVSNLKKSVTFCPGMTL